MSKQQEVVVGRGVSSSPTVRERLVSDLPVTERQLTVAGIHTAVLEGGDGPPVVFLQAEFALVWLRVIPGLVGTHRVVVPELPGIGDSDLPDGPYDVDVALRWLGDLVEQTCDAPPVLVGKGPAGALALRFAVDHSHRLAGLVLVDTHGLRRFRPSPGMALSFMGLMLRPTPQRVERSLGTYCFTDLQQVRHDMGDRWEWFSALALDHFRSRKARRAMRSLLPRLGGPLPIENLAGITVPTTLIWGREDVGMPVTVAEEASARFQWPLHVIDGARDDPAIERPEAFLGALDGRLEEG